MFCLSWRVCVYSFMCLSVLVRMLCVLLAVGSSAEWFGFGARYYPLFNVYLPCIALMILFSMYYISLFLILCIDIYLIEN